MKENRNVGSGLHGAAPSGGDEREVGRVPTAEKVIAGFANDDGLDPFLTVECRRTRSPRPSRLAEPGGKRAIMSSLARSAVQNAWNPASPAASEDKQRTSQRPKMAR